MVAPSSTVVLTAKGSQELRFDSFTRDGSSWQWRLSSDLDADTRLTPVIKVKDDQPQSSSVQDLSSLIAASVIRLGLALTIV